MTSDVTRAVRRPSILSLLVASPSSLFGLVGVVVVLLLATFGPYLAPYDPAELSATRLRPPSLEHLMGTETFGRDVLSRFLHGTRVSIFVGVSGVALSLIAGTIAGMVSGLFNGTLLDTLLMRGMDVVLAFPLYVLVPVMTGILGTRSIQLGPISLSNMVVVAFAIGLVQIPVFARVARASVLAEVRKDYVVAARSFGASATDLLFGNLLPNIQASLIVQAAFSLLVAIAIEAAVSFLGLGVQPPEASWGTMLADSRRYVILGSWWLVLFPAAAVGLSVLSINLLGDGLRDALDPRSRAISLAGFPGGQVALPAGKKAS